ncbi:hypothetical protein [Paraburkholderia flava]|nr:hypothetical protein [Paraburkholderia flava]
MKHVLYAIYSIVVVVLFSCSMHPGLGGSGWGGSSARGGYSSYGSHK